MIFAQKSETIGYMDPFKIYVVSVSGDLNYQGILFIMSFVFSKPSVFTDSLFCSVYARDIKDNKWLYV